MRVETAKISNKSNNIAFSGILNAGAVYAEREGYKGIHLLTQLTNSGVNRDLDEFRSLLQPGNFVQIEFFEFNCGLERELLLNGNRIVPIRQSLPLFLQALKLLKRIAEMSENEFHIEDNYLRRNGFVNSFIYKSAEEDLALFVKIPPEKIYNTVRIKEKANLMAEKVEEFFKEKFKGINN